MKELFLLLFVSASMYAQQFQMNDPTPSSNVISEINITVDRYYPIFSNSEKPYSNDRIIRLSDINGNYTTYLFFVDKYSPPKLEVKTKTLRFFYPDSYYDYITRRLADDTAYVVYREYKDGHKWGEIYFDKYP